MQLRSISRMIPGERPMLTALIPEMVALRHQIAVRKAQRYASSLIPSSGSPEQPRLVFVAAPLGPLGVAVCSRTVTLS
jgi:hypothetical protein